MYKPHTHCRACGYAKRGLGKAGEAKPMHKVLSLGLQPLANDFRTELEERAGHAPLEVLVCPNCGLAQLSVVVDPKILYSNYSYITSHSKTMLDHFNVIVEDIKREATATRSVLEIGSNDGTLLSFLKNNPFEEVLGCDPAENLCKIANSKGIVTFCGMFTAENCDCQKQKDVVIARHVMCHIDDWQDFMRGLERVTHKESLVCIEVPYYKDMLERGSWDQVYHEHLSYMSINAMDWLVRETAFHIHKVTHYPIHGGSVMIYLRRNESSVKPVFKYAEALAEGYPLEEWKELDRRKAEMIGQLRLIVTTAVTEGKRVVGYGASAKSTVWMNACGFTKREIAWIADNTPQKQNTFSPGSDVPIVTDKTLAFDQPDYCICFAWNFFPEIQKKEANFKGKWIVPVPEVHIV